MSYEKFRLTDDAISTNGVEAAPDKLTGTTQENKKVFDRLIRAVVKDIINGLAEQIGADVARFDSGEGKISAETAAALELDEGATLNDALVRLKNMAASGGIPTAEFVAVSKATAEAYGLEGDVNVDMVLQVITGTINEATSKSYSKEETLSPSTKTALGLSEDAAPDDAFNALNNKDVFKVGDTLTTARTDLGDNWLLCNGSTFDIREYDGEKLDDFRLQLTEDRSSLTAPPSGAMMTDGNSIVQVGDIYVSIVDGVSFANKPTLVYRHGLRVSAMHRAFYYNGVWVAVGSYNSSTKLPNVLVSEDPYDIDGWKANTVPKSLFDVRCYDGVWVASGASGTICTTTDPFGEWEVITVGLTSETMYSVDYDGTYWACSCNGAKVYYTTDLRGAWQSVVINTVDASTSGFGVRYAPTISKWIVLSGKTGKAYISYATTPGDTWTSFAAQSVNGYIPYTLSIDGVSAMIVAYNSNGVVALWAKPLSDITGNATFIDTNITVTPSQNAVYNATVIYTNGGHYVLNGASGSIRHGTALSSSYMSTTTYSQTVVATYACATDGEHVVTVGNDGNKVIAVISDVGKLGWRAYLKMPTTGSLTTYPKVEYGDGRWVITTSPSGSTTAEAIIHAYMTENITKDWATISISGTAGDTVVGIAYAKGVWCASGYNSTNGYPLVFTTDDPYRYWARLQLDSENAKGYESIAVDESGAFVVGGPKRFYRSIDPIKNEWEAIEFANASSHPCVSYSNGYWIAYKPESTTFYYTNDLGAAWTKVSLGSSFATPLLSPFYAHGMWWVIHASGNTAKFYTSHDIEGEYRDFCTISAGNLVSTYQQQVAIINDGEGFVFAGNYSNYFCTTQSVIRCLPTISQDDTYTYIKVKE